MSVTKSIKIKTGTDTFDARDIGAEAQYIDVSRDSSNDIIEDITEPGVEVATTEGLASTLKNIEANKQDKLPAYDTTPTQNSTNLVTSGGVYTAIQADSALSPTSTKPVQNKVVFNALDNKLNKNNVSTVEAINGTAVGDYEPGDIFVANNGNTYAATATITGGSTTIAVGTNCELKTLSSALSSLKDSLKDEIITRATLGAHNLFDLSIFPVTLTGAGVTHTINAQDGTISFHRDSASSGNHYYISEEIFKLKAGTYLLSATVSSSGAKVGIFDGTNYIYIEVTGTTSFTLNNDTDYKLYCFYASEASNDITFSNLMIRMSEDADTIFRPYVPTNSQLLSYKDNRILGAKNLLVYPYLFTDTLIDNMVVTTNSDGSIVLDGNNTSGDSKRANLSKVHLQKGTYKFWNVWDSGVYYFTLRDSSDAFVANLAGSKNVEFTISTEGDYYFALTIPNNASASNVTFYPMITLAADTDSTYQPYVMTNKDITSIVTDQVDKKYLSGDNIWEWGDVYLYTQSYVVFVKIPSGKYIFTADVSTTDTDADSNIILFGYSNGSNLQTSITRGKKQSISVTLTSDVDYIAFYGSDSYAHADNDISLFTNIILSSVQEANAIHTPSNVDLLSYRVNGIIGAKNFAPITIERLKKINNTGSWTLYDNKEVYVCNGVVFTIHTDENNNIAGIRITTTDPNGATDNTSLLFLDHRSDEKYMISRGNYILSKGNRINGVQCFINCYNSGDALVRQLVNITDSVESSPFTINYEDYVRLTAGIYIPSGTILNSAMTYPMIRNAYDTDSIYQPYAMTNQQLTSIASSINIDTENPIINSYITTTTTWSKTGLKFTLTKPAMVIARAISNNGFAQGVAIIDDTTGTHPGFFAITDGTDLALEPGSITATTYLSAGNYEIMAKYKSATSNQIKVFIGK